jgi:hypothetical protein
MRVMALVILVACGTDSGSGGAYTSIDQLTAAYQTASCTHLVACHEFADQTTCEKTNLHDASFLLPPTTVAYVLAGRIRYNGNDVAACLAKIATKSCAINGLDHRESFAACIARANVYSGTLTASEKCSVNEECISQQCSNQCDTNQSCCTAGTCIGSTAPIPEALSSIGQPCGADALSNSCVEGAYCNNTAGTCFALKSVGAPCNDPSECGDGIGCFGTSTLNCTTPAHLGQSCVTLSCGDEGTYCNFSTKVCTAFALLGGPCNDPNDGDCTTYETCDATMKCVAYPATGASCAGTNGACNDVGSLCNESQICELQGDTGAACVGNADCDSGDCNLTTHVCDAVTVCQ